MGKFVFSIASLVQKARFARRGILLMTTKEQKQSVSPRRMSDVLWDLFSGSESYTNVFLRTLHPAYIGSLLRNLVVGNLPGSASRNGHSQTQEKDHVQH